MDDHDNKPQQPAQCPYRDELPELFSTPKARHAQPTPSDEANSSQHPFVTFKQFIDDQFAAITGLNRTSYKNWRMQMQTAREEARQRKQEKHTRWTGRAETPDHDEMLVQRITKENGDELFDNAVNLLAQSAKLNAHIDPAKIAALYHDDDFLAFERDPFAVPRLSFGGACYYMPESGYNMPSTASVFTHWPRPSPRWLSFDWFKHSAYSPITLEADPNLPGSRQWRSAFEDLIDASLGKEMALSCLSRERSSDPFQPYSPSSGLGWVIGLQCRGVLPPMLPSIYRNGGYGSVKTLADWAKARQADCELLAHQWAPRTPVRELSELVRELATPEPEIDIDMHDEHAMTEMDVYTYSQDQNTTATKTADNSQPPHAGPSTSITILGPTGPAQVQAGLTDLRTTFWKFINDEDSEAVAAITKAWESSGLNIQHLINDKDVIAAYLRMDTSPTLWALCEGLEKADSELYKRQERIAELDAASDQAYDRWEALEFERDDLLNDGDVDSNDRETVLTPRSGQTSEAQARSATGNRAVMANVAAVSEELRPKVNPPPTKEQAYPRCLAVLTTVQTTVLPDGTVTKKTVLKQRFADGKEETTESVEVERPDASPSKTDLTEPMKKEKKGWFWS